jgi:hypothetical protein
VYAVHMSRSRREYPCCVAPARTWRLTWGDVVPVARADLVDVEPVLGAVEALLQQLPHGATQVPLIMNRDVGESQSLIQFLS